MEGRAELQTILSNYFDAHSADETKEALSDLLHAWVNPAPLTKPSNLEIANMVFFVSTLSRMFRQVSTFKGSPGHVTDLIDALPADDVEDFLNETLQAWICPVDHSIIATERILTADHCFRLLGKLVSNLECVAELEGGVLCA